jgi:hypothetical protein
LTAIALLLKDLSVVPKMNDANNTDTEPVSMMPKMDGSNDTQRQIVPKMDDANDTQRPIAFVFPNRNLSIWKSARQNRLADFDTAKELFMLT